MTEQYAKQFILANILTSTEACESLQVSRQRLSAIVKEGKLIPIKSGAQGMIFLRSDVDKYLISKSKNPFIANHIPLYDYSGSTHKSVKFFEDNISSLSQIHSIYIYFNDMDAIINNFYIPSEAYSIGNLKTLDIPHFIIRDIDGKELWLGGCNCGYGGEGPHGSEAVLNSLVQSGKINLTDSDINKIFNERVINIYVNEDKSTDTVCRKCLVDSHDDKGRVRAYYHKGNIVLLQSELPSFHDYKKHMELSVIDKYRAFIPNPKEVICFPTCDMAMEAGYVGHNNYFSPKAYKVIIIDSTGRELWLNPYIEQNKPFHRQERVSEILESCGFNFEQKTVRSQRISDWLDTTLRFIRPTMEPKRFLI